MLLPVPSSMFQVNSYFLIVQKCQSVNHIASRYVNLWTNLANHLSQCHNECLSYFEMLISNMSNSLMYVAHTRLPASVITLSGSMLHSTLRLTCYFFATFHSPLFDNDSVFKSPQDCDSGEVFDWYKCVAKTLRYLNLDAGAGQTRLLGMHELLWTCNTLWYVLSMCDVSISRLSTIEFETPISLVSIFPGRY